MDTFTEQEADARAALEAEAARVKAAAAERDRARARADAAAAARQARADAPGRYYGVHRGGATITYAELPLTPDGVPPQAKSRRITIEDVNYEHVSTDADGVWIYREM